MPRRVPRLRKCRKCRRNFDPVLLVTEPAERDARGYLLPAARWCRPCADVRLADLLTDERCAEDAAMLASAIRRFDARITVLTVLVDVGALVGKGPKGYAMCEVPV